jgi:hypothetical protein
MYFLTLIFELLSLLSLFMVIDNYNTYSHKNVFDVLFIFGVIKFGFLFTISNYGISWAILISALILACIFYSINTVSNIFEEKSYIVLMFLCSIFANKIVEYSFGSYYIGELSYDKILLLPIAIAVFLFLVLIYNLYTKTNLPLYFALIKNQKLSNFLHINSQIARTWLNLFVISIISFLSIISAMYYNNATLQSFNFSSYILVFLGVFLPKSLGLSTRIGIICLIYFIPESLRLLNTNNTILIQFKEIFTLFIILFVITTTQKDFKKYIPKILRTKI